MSDRETPGQIRAKYRSAFDQFYKVYPRRVAPSEAERVFADLCHKGADPAYLVGKARAYAGTVDPDDLKYVPSPANWLKHGRYDDQDLFTNQREQEQEWLRECWRKTDVRAVENKFHITYPKQYPPENLTTPDQIKMWFQSTARAWIAEVAEERKDANEP